MNVKVKDNLDKLLQVKNLSNGETALYIYGEIVSDGSWAWDNEQQYPAKIRDFLADIEGRDLDIYVNSPGGSVFAAMTIVNMLQRHAGKKTCHVDGYAASSAGVIALSCDRVIMPSNTFLMIHQAVAVAAGNADQLERDAEMLRKCNEGILGIYKSKLADGVTIEQVKELMDKETWFTAAEAAKTFHVEMTDAIVEPAAFAGSLSIASAPKVMKDQAKKVLAIEAERTRLLKNERKVI